MPRVGFESTIPVFERVKTFHSLDRTATVIDMLKSEDANSTHSRGAVTQRNLT
jgi:hypothetical protein